MTQYKNDQAPSHSSGDRALSERAVGLASDRSLRKGAERSYSSLKQVCALVKEALLNGGLGVLDKNTPLADVIQPGMSVLLKPNWVLHYNKSGKTLDCSITHHAFIIAVLREVLAAKPERVVIADAPIQTADFAQIVSAALIEEVQRANADVRVEIQDLRNTVAIERKGILTRETDKRSNKSIVSFDLGRDSLLEEISNQADRFRNTCYDPDDMRIAHGRGHHLFRLCREPFEADVFLNLPKLKAHGKAGITGALKNIVGVNADKDILPHHRLGGSAFGGDCYKGLKPLKRLSECCLDHANRCIGRLTYFYWIKMAAAANSFYRLCGDSDLEGKWYGNDTVWRMVLDLNRLLLYGRRDGTLSETPQRSLLTITDGILAGERNGPLAPEPLPLGLVTFGSSSPSMDLVHAGLFHFDWKKIPLIRESFRQDFRFPLTKAMPEQIEVRTGEGVMSPEQVSEAFGLSCRPPDGWINHIEGWLWKAHSRQ